jgi:hypothetical protein
MGSFQVNLNSYPLGIFTTKVSHRRHLPGKSAHLQTVTGHFSNTDLRDVVDICCRYELQLTQN